MSKKRSALQMGAILIGLSPPLYAEPQAGGLWLTQRSLLLEDSRIPRDAALDRLQQIRFAFRERPAADGQLQAWTRAYGGYGTWQGDAYSSRLQRHSAGVLFGIDRPLQGMWVAGVLGGFGRSELQVDGSSGDSDVDSYHLSAYAATRYYQLGFKFGVGYSWHDLHAQRKEPGEVLKADGRAATTQVFGEASYPQDFRDFTIEPFAGLAYVHLDAQGMRERGGAHAVHLGRDEQDGAYLTLGWRAATTWQLQQRRLIGRGSLALRHGFIEPRLQSDVQRADGSVLDISGRTFERDNLRLDLSLDYELVPEVYVGVLYASQFAEDARDQSLGARMSLKF